MQIHKAAKILLQRPGNTLDNQESVTGVDIAFVIESLQDGGAQRVVTTLANEWARHGFRVCIVTLQPHNTDFYSVEPSVLRVAVGVVSRSGAIGGRIIANLRDVFALRRELGRINAKTVVSFVHSMNVLTILAAIALPCSVIVSERNDPARQSVGFFWRLLRRLLYPYASTVTANTHGALETMRSYVPASKLAYVPNPIMEPSKSHPSCKTTPASPFILTVGRLHEQKAHDRLLLAFATFLTQTPGWRLRILGNGPLLDTLQLQAEDLGIDAHVDWKGTVADPFEHYPSADIFALPSQYEGQPNALMEAMSCGLAVVVTDGSPGPLEFVENEVTGLIVPVDNDKALCAALLRLARDKTLRKKLGKAARERVSCLKINKVLPIWEKLIGLDAHKNSSFSD